MHLPSSFDLSKATPEEQRRILKLARELDEAAAADKARNSFHDYMRFIWPPFISGRHHKLVANAFDRIIAGDLKRLIINMPPRHTKSEFTSWGLPSKYLGHYPNRKVIQASHTAELAHGFGRRVRNLITDSNYQKVFPGTKLSTDSTAAGRWHTSEGGEYHAMGIGAKMAGKGADLMLIDDPHSEQDYIAAMAGNTAPFDAAYEWYTSGPRQRMQPGGAIVVTMTRWHLRDLTGRIIGHMAGSKGRDQWEIIEFPALLPPDDKPLWPEFWSLEEYLAIREELPVAQWSAQFLQRPTHEEGALLKREWWRLWTANESPKCEYVIQTWDTAFRRTERSDYSACTTWGVFYHPDPGTGEERANIILLDAERGRWEFPVLKRKALELYQSRQPDALVVEGKASGDPLIAELRAMGIPVQDFTPVRGTKQMPNDKIHRVNAITDMFASGMVWYPDRRWADEVREECAAFPMGDHDDYVDTVVMAMMRFRKGGFIRLDSDFKDEPMRRRRAAYY